MHLFYPRSCLFPSGLVTHHFLFQSQPHCCLLVSFNLTFLFCSWYLPRNWSTRHFLPALWFIETRWCLQSWTPAVYDASLHFPIDFSSSPQPSFARSLYTLLSSICLSHSSLAAGVRCLKGETLGRSRRLPKQTRWCGYREEWETPSTYL